MAILLPELWRQLQLCSDPSMPEPCRRLAASAYSCELRDLTYSQGPHIRAGQPNAHLMSASWRGQLKWNEMNSCCNGLHFPAKLPLLHITFFSTIARVSWQVTQSIPWQQWISHHAVQNQPSKHGYLDMCLAHNAKRKKNQLQSNSEENSILQSTMRKAKIRVHIDLQIEHDVTWSSELCHAKSHMSAHMDTWWYWHVCNSLIIRYSYRGKPNITGNSIAMFLRRDSTSWAFFSDNLTPPVRPATKEEGPFWWVDATRDLG